jgi:hypothetical protein
MKRIAATLVFACALASIARAADPVPPETLLTKPGKLLVNEELSQMSEKGPWRYGPGEWSIKDGSLKGVELAKDKHGAVLRRLMKFQNAIVRYEFQFDGAKGTSFSVNDAKEHVCRVQMGARLFRVQKDDHDHAGPDKAVVFETKTRAIAPNVWHTLVVEMHGPEMVATLDGQHTSFGSDALIATEKANFGFTVSGDGMRFRNLCVWEAEPNPDWTTKKADLEKHRAAAASPAP